MWQDIVDNLSGKVENPFQSAHLGIRTLRATGDAYTRDRLAAAANREVIERKQEDAPHLKRVENELVFLDLRRNAARGELRQNADRLALAAGQAGLLFSVAEGSVATHKGVIAALAERAGDLVTEAGRQGHLPITEMPNPSKYENAVFAGAALTVGLFLALSLGTITGLIPTEALTNPDSDTPPEKLLLAWAIFLPPSVALKYMIKVLAMKLAEGMCLLHGVDVRAKNGEGSGSPAATRPHLFAVWAQLPVVVALVAGQTLVDGIALWMVAHERAAATSTDALGLTVFLAVGMIFSLGVAAAAFAVSRNQCLARMRFSQLQAGLHEARAKALSDAKVQAVIALAYRHEFLVAELAGLDTRWGNLITLREALRSPSVSKVTRANVEAARRDAAVSLEDLMAELRQLARGKGTKVRRDRDSKPSSGSFWDRFRRARHDE